MNFFSPKKNLRKNNDLLSAIENLSKEAKEKFKRIFEIRKIKIILTDELIDKKYPKFKEQNLIIIRDKILFRETVYNLSRQKRKQPEKKEVFEGYDPFCQYQTETPIDELGRLENDFAVTAANLAKMADYHSLVIFKKHNWEDLKEEDFTGTLDLAKLWFQKIKEYDQNIKTQILIWNYHYRSGASILHPHFQVLAFKEVPLKINFLKQQLDLYQEKFKKNYFDDYFALAQELKIGEEKEGLRIYLNLTPAKEKEIDFQGELNEKNTVYFWNILQKLKELGVNSFNFFYLLDSPFLKNLGFLIDRGDINKVNSDFGSLEIFLLPVVSYDPLELARSII